MKKGFTLIELMIVIAIIGVVASIAIPGLLAAQRASNERNASASLASIRTANVDFRANDRDGNRCTDFWTADIFGLYGLTPLGGTQTQTGDTSDASLAIRLIDASLAGADGSTDIVEYDNVNFADSIGTGSPKAGYVFLKFDHEEVGGGMTELQLDTDGPTGLGEVHDWGRYAFMAVPVSLSSGKYMFIVNADQTIWKYALPNTYTFVYTPAEGTTDSTTSVTGTGQAGFEDALMYPQAPGAVGCAKLD